MIGDKVRDEFASELLNALALVSNPVQGILSLLRWQREFSRSESSAIQDLLLNNRSLSNKLSQFGCSVSDTERHSLLYELQLCLGSSEHQLFDTLNKKRGSKEIAPSIDKDSIQVQKKLRHGLENSCHPLLGASGYSVDDIVTGKSGSCNSRDAGCTNSCGSFKPYSESALWSTQQHFYATRGAGVWERGEVPSLISSNSFVANMYVKMIVEVMLKLDRKQRFDEKKKGASVENKALSNDEEGNFRRPKLRIAVVEIGAGHGLLSLLLARKFHEVMHQPLPFSVDPDNCNGNSNGVEDSVSSKQFSCLFDVTVIATDFHSSVFEGLLLLPWTR